MSNYIHYRNFTSNHVARSIIVTPSSVRPRWMDTDTFRSNQWPTPAMRTYETIVSNAFVHFYFSQDPSRREVLLNAVSREFHHEGGGRIYKRLSSNGDILVKQSLDEFKVIILKRLENLRYDASQFSERIDYNSIQSSFSDGERVMVSSRSSIMYEGIFQFDSVINSNYCYIQFDSRQHIMRWEKRLVQKINVYDTSNQRVTRQMARRRLAESDVTRFHGTAQRSHQETETLSDIGTVSDNSSDSDNENNSFDQGGTGVARARNRNLFDSSSSEESDNEEEHNEVVDEIIPGGDTYEILMERHGDGTENKRSLEEEWLRQQGFTTNPFKDEVCYICFTEIEENEIVYDIKCAGTLKHPLHCECARGLIEKRHTCCGVCKFEWLD